MYNTPFERFAKRSERRSLCVGIKVELPGRSVCPPTVSCTINMDNKSLCVESVNANAHLRVGDAVAALGGARGYVPRPVTGAAVGVGWHAPCSLTDAAVAVRVAAEGVIVVLSC